MYIYLFTSNVLIYFARTDIIYAMQITLEKSICQMYKCTFIFLFFDNLPHKKQNYIQVIDTLKVIKHHDCTLFLK